jgi:hypothetical protein
VKILLCGLASLAMSMGRVWAQSETALMPPFEVRIELSSPVSSLLVWEPVPITVVLTSVGPGNAPMGEESWRGVDDGTRLLLVVTDGAPHSPQREFVFEPYSSPMCSCSGGPKVPSRLRHGDELTRSFAVGGRAAKTVVSGVERGVCEPVLPSAGSYELRVHYRHHQTTFMSNILVMQAQEPSGAAAAALERFQGFGRDALWLYEPQLRPVRLTGEQRASLESLTIDFGLNPYGELARYALADADSWTVFEDPTPMPERRDVARRALELWAGLVSSDPERMADAARASERLRAFLTR